MIEQSGRHLLDVVNTLLDMSRIQSGNFDYKPDLMDASELVLSCCNLMKLKAGEGAVQLIANPAGPQEIVADPRACRQVLINLISNALKYTGAGGTVAVSLNRAVDGLEITVADTGVGIAAEDLPRLGTPVLPGGHQRLCPQPRGHRPRTLGCAGSRRPARRHDPHRERAGLGTIVTVTLPYAGCDQDAPGGPRRSSPPSAVRRRQSPRL